MPVYSRRPRSACYRGATRGRAVRCMDARIERESAGTAAAGSSDLRLELVCARGRCEAAVDAMAGTLRLGGNARSRRENQRLAGFQPILDALRIGDARQLAIRIQQYDHDRPIDDVGEHYQALARLADESCLAELNVPLAAAHQRIGVVESEHMAAGLDLDPVTRRRGELADQRISRGRLHHAREVPRRGDVLAR